MENCLVTRLKGVVNNPNLKTLFTGYRDKADFTANGQYVQIVGSELPIKTVKTTDCRVEIIFIGKNDNTQGCLFHGTILSDNENLSRALLGKKYASGSVGQSTYELISSYGSGASNGGTVTLDKDTEYKAVIQTGTCTIYDMSENLVGTITYTESGVFTLDKCYYGMGTETNRPDMFWLKNLKIIKKQNNEVLLDVYPAVDGNNEGCLYDAVNECFYHANTGQLAVSND